MAWNDPGKNENPWKRKPEQGPPDLDEVLRRFQKKLRSFFGGGGPRPVGGGSSGGSAAFGIGYIVVGLVLLWVAAGSFYLNEAAERSVITRFGKYVKTTGAGFNLRLPWPIDRRTVVNVTEFRSFSDRTRMLTQDEALVDINLAVQYRRADPVKFTFNVRDPEETLGEVSESAIREIIGQSKLDFVLELGRQEISARTKELVQRTITAYNTGIEVISVNLQDVSVPEQVAPAQKDAIKAREDKDRATLSRRRPTPTTSCRRRAASRSAWSRARSPTRRGWSPTRKARRRASCSSPRNTSARPRSLASGSTSRPWSRCSVLRPRSSSTPTAPAT